MFHTNLFRFVLVFVYVYRIQFFSPGENIKFPTNISVFRLLFLYISVIIETYPDKLILEGGTAMFHLLVVDDEKNERDCLLYLIQDAGLPFEVREAENGADALEMLQDWPADVILTDVQMPVMGGIEFLREASALYPEAHIIIFSNYAEFEYAKAAIHLGVENYILKPVVPQELENTLNAVVEQITEARTVNRLYQTSMLQSALQLSVYGSLNPDALSEDLRAQLGSFQRMILLELPGAYLEKGYAKLCEALQNQLGQEIVSLNLSPQALVFLREEIGGAHALGQSLCAAVRESCGILCSIAVSQPLSSYGSLREAYSALEQLMEQRFWNPAERVFTGVPQQPMADEMTEETDDDTLLNRIKDALAARDEERFTQSLDLFFSKYRRQSNQSQIYVKFIFSNLIASLYPSLPEEEKKKRGGGMDELISALYLQQDISKIIDMVQEIARAVAGTFGESGRGLRRELVIVLDYIHEHYSQELSVELLASTVFLSPDYLSRIFKKAMGKSLYQHIRQFRMEKASELLLNTTKKVIDIGTETGYPNYSYFCQSFREYFGTSPDRYRQEAKRA